MNSICIVGEYSGVGYNLKLAYESLGFDVDHLNDGDAFKLIGNTYSRNSYINYGKIIIDTIKTIITKKYDLCIFLSPFVFKQVSICRLLNQYLMDISKKSILICCTSDSIWWNHWDRTIGRSPHLGFLEDTKFIPHRNSSMQYLKYNTELANAVDNIVSLAPDYHIPYRNAGFECRQSHFPIVPKYNSSRNTFEKVYHGITRPGFKGSALIIDYLQEKFLPEQVLITNKINFNEYQKNLEKAKIYFDQIFSQAPAMAALQAMQICPIVITGVARSKDDIYLLECPAIDFMTEKHHILEMMELSELQLNDRIEKGNKFVNKYHNHIIIAEDLLND